MDTRNILAMRLAMEMTRPHAGYLTIAPGYDEEGMEEIEALTLEERGLLNDETI